MVVERDKIPAGSEPHCHCGGPAAFSHCCGPLLSGAAVASNAEQLMRSRYSAYVLGDVSYLLASWHPDTRPSRIRLNPAQRWLGLSIRNTGGGGEKETVGTVEFVARYKIDGRGHRLHENSRFEKLDGRWYYRDGDHLQ